MDTKTKILDVAEKIFAEEGIQNTSVRDIVKAAGVNIAAIHYHFGSKNALIQKIITRRIAPVTAAKLQRLAEIENGAVDKKPDLEDILRAFIEPHIHMHKVNADRVRIIMKLMIQLEDSTTKSELFYESEMFEVLQRYLQVLHRVLPQLSLTELHCRFKFMVGSVHALMVEHSLPSHTLFDIAKIETSDMINCMITFLKAGISAPPVLNK